MKANETTIPDSTDTRKVPISRYLVVGMASILFCVALTGLLIVVKPYLPQSDYTYIPPTIPDKEEEAATPVETAVVTPADSILESDGNREDAESMSDEKNAPVLSPPGSEPVPPLASELPPENIGGLGDPEDRLPDRDQAPEAEIESCGDFFAELFGGASQLGTKDGPVEAGFTAEFDGILNPWSLMTVSRLPDDLLTINIVTDDESRTFTFEAEDGGEVDPSPRSATWKAPSEPGIYCFKIKENDSENAMCLHIAVMKPWDGESEHIGDYHIGKYQDKPYQDNPRYKKPRGFIEVTKENEDTWLSPHLQLSQFVCKQKSDYPKYMLIDSRLLLKLETLIAELEKDGREASHLYISSGFRTPAYNVALGNTTSYSRHLYGDAADLFVDSNRDGKLDDLDFSGSTDDGDAQFIQSAVETVTGKHRYLKGGLGFYSSANYRNPFIHIDTRGYPARWKK